MQTHWNQILILNHDCLVAGRFWLVFEDCQGVCPQCIRGEAQVPFAQFSRQSSDPFLRRQCMESLRLDYSRITRSIVDKIIV